MDVVELQQLRLNLESDRVERKRSASDAEAIKKAICALANDLPGHNLPGVLLIGIEDSGECAGIEVTDEVLKRVSGYCSDGSVLPKPSCTVQHHLLDGCNAIVVEISPAYAPPVRFKGRTYVRVGPTTQIASPEQERRLSERRRAADLPYDLSPITGATLDDLDLDLFKNEYLPSAVSQEVIDQNQRTLTQQLMSLRMVGRIDDRVPTVTGLLTIGKQPRSFIGAAYVQFVRFEGTGLADPIKTQHEIEGPVSSMLRQLDELLAVHVSVETRIVESSREIRSPDYPVPALQQMIRNAIMHRSYEGTNAPVRVYWFQDRVEVMSPGGPFGQVTRANLGQPGITDYRNPHLAEVLKNLGYVQRFGAGFEIARSEMAKNGNPDLAISAEEASVCVTLRRRPA